MEDTNSMMFLGKFCLAVFLGSIWTIALSSCGLTNGTTTWGTVGYLSEVNRGKNMAPRAQYGAPSASYGRRGAGAPLDDYTAKERQRLDEYSSRDRAALRRLTK